MCDDDCENCTLLVDCDFKHLYTDLENIEE